MNKKLKSLRDLMAQAHDDAEVLGYIVISLAMYQSFNRGMSADQITELCGDIERYYEARQERREMAEQKRAKQ